MKKFKVKLIISFLLVVMLMSPLTEVFKPFRQVRALPIPKNLTVLIDAGHGGRDKGSTGLTTGVYESDLNLLYSKQLEEYFNNFGIRVIQTRKDEDALFVGARGFIKKKDMQVRKNLIEAEKPNMVISLHMNEFVAGKNQSGAQVFYEEGSETGKELSGYMQAEFNKNQPKQRINLAGDFYLLRDLSIPAVIVECGFLSNEAEEKLLQTKAHKEKICSIIFKASINYFFK
jgi:N-acetylmuramoyl-L-alanine amidase